MNQMSQSVKRWCIWQRERVGLFSRTCDIYLYLCLEIYTNIFKVSRVETLIFLLTLWVAQDELSRQIIPGLFYTQVTAECFPSLKSSSTLSRLWSQTLLPLTCRAKPREKQRRAQMVQGALHQIMLRKLWGNWACSYVLFFFFTLM